MITEETYLKAKKIIETYESEQLNKHAVSGQSEQCSHINKVWTINQADQKIQKCKDCGEYYV